MIQASHDELMKKLHGYMDQNSDLRTILEYTKSRFYDATNLTAHNWEHAYRDMMNSIIIGEAEGANMRIVLPAAIMHDIGFLYGAEGGTHGSVGAEKLSQYLNEGNISIDNETQVEIASCIRTHKGSMHDEHPETLEAKVVADADLLEKFGPFGIYQTALTYGEFKFPLSKILGRRNTLNSLVLETVTGREIAESGREYVAEFFDELEKANSPYGDYQL